MKLNIEIMTGWQWVKRAMLKTQGLRPKTPLPTNEQKRLWLMCEHSPIKLLEFWIDMDELRQWIGVHLLRHPFTLPFICSQRNDRQKDYESYVNSIIRTLSDDILNSEEFKNGNIRDFLPQGSLNDHTFVMNAQTLINISRKRLCRAASKETREAWMMVHEWMKENEPQLAACMVPNCIYRAFCPESPEKSCKYVLTDKFKKELDEYREGFVQPL